MSFFLLNRAPRHRRPLLQPMPSGSSALRAVAELSPWDFTINLGIPCVFLPSWILHLFAFLGLLSCFCGEHPLIIKAKRIFPLSLVFWNFTIMKLLWHGPIFIYYAVSSVALSGNGRNLQYLSLLRNLLELFSWWFPLLVFLFPVFATLANWILEVLDGSSNISIFSFLFPSAFYSPF